MSTNLQEHTTVVQDVLSRLICQIEIYEIWSDSLDSIMTERGFGANKSVTADNQSKTSSAPLQTSYKCSCCDLDMFTNASLAAHNKASLHRKKRVLCDLLSGDLFATNDDGVESLLGADCEYHAMNIIGEDHIFEFRLRTRMNKVYFWACDCCNSFGKTKRTLIDHLLSNSHRLMCINVYYPQCWPKFERLWYHQTSRVCKSVLDEFCGENRKKQQFNDPEILILEEDKKTDEIVAELGLFDDELYIVTENVSPTDVHIPSTVSGYPKPTSTDCGQIIMCCEVCCEYLAFPNSISLAEPLMSNHCNSERHNNKKMHMTNQVSKCQAYLKSSYEGISTNSVQSLSFRHLIEKRELAETFGELIKTMQCILCDEDFQFEQTLRHVNSSEHRKRIVLWHKREYADTLRNLQGESEGHDELIDRLLEQTLAERDKVGEIRVSFPELKTVSDTVLKAKEKWTRQQQCLARTIIQNILESASIEVEYTDQHTNTDIPGLGYQFVAEILTDKPIMYKPTYFCHLCKIWLSYTDTSMHVNGIDHNLKYLHNSDEYSDVADMLDGCTDADHMKIRIAIEEIQRREGIIYPSLRLQYIVKFGELQTVFPKAIQRRSQDEVRSIQSCMNVKNEKKNSCNPWACLLPPDSYYEKFGVVKTGQRKIQDISEEEDDLCEGVQGVLESVSSSSEGLNVIAEAEPARPCFRCGSVGHKKWEQNVEGRVICPRYTPGQTVHKDVHGDLESVSSEGVNDTAKVEQTRGCYRCGSVEHMKWEKNDKGEVICPRYTPGQNKAESRRQKMSKNQLKKNRRNMSNLGHSTRRAAEREETGRVQEGKESRGMSNLGDSARAATNYKRGKEEKREGGVYTWRNGGGSGSSRGSRSQSHELQHQHPDRQQEQSDDLQAEGMGRHSFKRQNRPNNSGRREREGHEGVDGEAEGEYASNRNGRQSSQGRQTHSRGGKLQHDDRRGPPKIQVPPKKPRYESYEQWKEQDRVKKMESRYEKGGRERERKEKKRHSNTSNASDSQQQSPALEDAARDIETAGASSSIVTAYQAIAGQISSPKASGTGMQALLAELVQREKRMQQEQGQRLTQQRVTSEPQQSVSHQRSRPQVPEDPIRDVVNFGHASASHRFTPNTPPPDPPNPQGMSNASAELANLLSQFTANLNK